VSVLQRTVPSASCVLIIGFLVAVIPDGVCAQALGRRVGPQFPHVLVNARSVAVADAAIGMVNDNAGVRTNPALLGFQRASSVSFSTTRLQKDVSVQHLGVLFNSGRHDAISGHLEVLHFGGLQFYYKDDIRKRGFELRGGFSYGRVISEDLSMGATVEFLNATTDVEPTSAVSFDIGFAYTPGKYIRAGFSLRGLGTDYRVDAPVLEPDQYDARLPRLLGLGVTFDYPIADRTQRIVIHFQNDKFIGQRGILYRFGLEYYPFLPLGLRLGLVVRGAEVSPRVGLGMAFWMVTIDYAHVFFKQAVRQSHFFTVSVTPG
jgi:hypothetical protein